MVHFGATVNPVAQTDPITAPSNPGERALSIDEVRAIWRASEESFAPRIAVAVKFLITTGQRTLEVLEMASGEIDADEKTWTIPAGRRKSRWKQRYDHVIPLEQLHLDLIERARSMGDGGQLTFAGLTEGEPMTPEYIGDALARFAKQAGIPHFTPRDLRRTWKTLAGRYGIDLQLRNRIQGHALTDVGSRHYDRQPDFGPRNAPGRILLEIDQCVDRRYQPSIALLLVPDRPEAGNVFGVCL